MKTKSPFIESLQRDMCLRGYAYSTEKTYLTWIRRYIYFCDKRHPSDVPIEEISNYLTHLAADRHVSVNTQKVILNSLVYLYQKFLQIEVGDLGFKLARLARWIILLEASLANNGAEHKKNSRAHHNTRAAWCIKIERRH